MPYPEPRPCPTSWSLSDGQPKNKEQTYMSSRVPLFSAGKATCREYLNCRSRTRTGARIAAALDAAGLSSMEQLPAVPAKSGEGTGVDASWPTSLQNREYYSRLKIRPASPRGVCCGLKVETHSADLEFPCQ